MSFDGLQVMDSSYKPGDKGSGEKGSSRSSAECNVEAIDTLVRCFCNKITEYTDQVIDDMHLMLEHNNVHGILKPARVNVGFSERTPGITYAVHRGYYVSRIEEKLAEGGGGYWPCPGITELCMMRDEYNKVFSMLADNLKRLRVRQEEAYAALEQLTRKEGSSSL